MTTGQYFAGGILSGLTFFLAVDSLFRRAVRRHQDRRLTILPVQLTCESCGAPPSIRLPDGSTWCEACDLAAIQLGYGGNSA
jgi:hypothetical protein